MNALLTLFGRKSGGVTVVVMQPAELLPDIAGETDDFSAPLFTDAGAVHAGIDVEEESDAGLAPSARLFAALDQNRDAGLRELARNFQRASSIRTHNREGKQDIGGAALTSRQQFECRRALQVRNAMSDKAAHRGGQFRRLDMRTPAVGITGRHVDRSLNVCVH